MRVTMTELTRFFRRPDNHFMDFPSDLQTIYKDDIIDRCAPSRITHTAKYNPPQPQIASMNAALPENDDTSQEERELEDDDLPDPRINAARATMGNSDKTSYTPTRCKVCGMTQKECHQAMKTLHDPDDPTKCCFRGPKYIAEKHVKETVMQYNLKNKGDYPPTTQDKDKPPQNASIPNPKINAASAKIEQEEEIPQPIANTSRFDPIQDLITGIEAATNEQQLHSPAANMLNEIITDQPKDKEKAIHSLGELQYCEDCNEFGEAGNACEYCIPSYSCEEEMEGSNSDKQLHTPSVAMLNTKITAFFHKNKSQKHKHNTSDK